jgi:peptidoglycan/LPS O-acetylase OafA/YrhL
VSSVAQLVAKKFCLAVAVVRRGLGLCWYAASYGFHIHTGGKAAPGSWSLIAGYGLVALGCCFMLVAFLGLDPRFLPGWAVYLGRISYGLYVFHSLALHIVGRIYSHDIRFGSLTLLSRVVAAMGLTILIAAFSYRYFETPFLKMKKRYEIVASRPV